MEVDRLNDSPDFNWMILGEPSEFSGGVYQNTPENKNQCGTKAETINLLQIIFQQVCKVYNKQHDLLGFTSILTWL